MESGTYAQINYHPDDLDDVSVTEVDRQETVEQALNDEITQKEASETASMEMDGEKVISDEQMQETKQRLEEMADKMSEEISKEAESAVESVEDYAEVNVFEVPENLEAVEEIEETIENTMNQPDVSVEPRDEEATEKEKIVMVPDEVQDVLKQYLSSTEDIQRTLRRLETKFSEEVLNGENRDGAVKTMYKELNEYKAGIVEKALKNVLYDIVDIRETMLSQIKYLREKNGADTISLDEFESYADDIGDILEKHDVTIYKGETGEENVAVRQKIVRKVETEEDELVKKVAENLSYGYEYASKILYPEKISVYVKKK